MHLILFNLAQLVFAVILYFLFDFKDPSLTQAYVKYCTNYFIGGFGLAIILILFDYQRSQHVT
jgi:hypothetical protein